jgi:hypothetical protein
MFWTIDYDDFEGKFCGQGKYPLLTAVKDQLCKSVEEKELYKQQQRQQSNAIQTDTKYQNPNNNLNKNGLNQMPVQIPIQNQYIPNNILLTSNDQSIQANSGYGNMNSNLKENTNSAKKSHGSGIISTELDSYEISKIYEKLEQAPQKNKLTSNDQSYNSVDVSLQENNGYGILNNNLKENKNSAKKAHGSGTISTELDSYEISKIYEKLENLDKTTTTKAPPTEQEAIDKFVCMSDGMFADLSSDCNTFFTCLWTDTRNAKKIRFVCPDGTKFDQVNKVCDWAWKTNCQS